MTLNQLKKFILGKNADLSDNIKHECPIFSSKTESPVYINKFNEGVAVLEYMSPRSYLMECKKLHSCNISLKKYIKEVVNEDIAEKYSKNMEKGDKFPIPVLDYELLIQEGRHRARAAELLEYGSIPVIVLKQKKQ
jgi:hypothetical protein